MASKNLALFTPQVRAGLWVLYGSTSTLATIGNIIVIIVLSFGVGFLPQMRLHLISLAIADILMAIYYMNLTLANVIHVVSDPILNCVLALDNRSLSDFKEWKLWDWTCYTYQATGLLSVFASTYTLLLIAIDRYVTHGLDKIKFQKSFSNFFLQVLSHLSAHESQFGSEASQKTSGSHMDLWPDRWWNPILFGRYSNQDLFN